MGPLYFQLSKEHDWPGCTARWFLQYFFEGKINLKYSGWWAFQCTADEGKAASSQSISVNRPIRFKKPDGPICLNRWFHGALYQMSARRHVPWCQRPKKTRPWLHSSRAVATQMPTRPRRRWTPKDQPPKTDTDQIERMFVSYRDRRQDSRDEGRMRIGKIFGWFLQAIATLG